ncbi:MAG: hypothetical protein KC493_14985 [Bacteriovoracaceae bacterium]|nr:hypothetical protein [Bacteriovoracaceae bacterium]
MNNNYKVYIPLIATVCAISSLMFLLSGPDLSNTQFSGHLWNKNHLLRENSLQSDNLDYNIYFPLGFKKSQELGLQMEINKYIENLPWNEYEKQTDAIFLANESKVTQLFNTSIYDSSSISYFGGCGFMNAASSEVPFNFLPKHGQKLTAIGRAGSSPLEYLIRLSSIPKDVLKNANIVIDLFPDQYRPKAGLHPQVFLDYIPHDVLTRVLFENTDPTIHQSIKQFLIDHKEDFLNPSYTHLSYIYNKRSYRIKAYLFEYIPSKIHNLRLKLKRSFVSSSSTIKRSSNIDWQSLKLSSQESFKKMSSSNKFYIRDKVFQIDFGSKENQLDAKHFVSRKENNKGWEELILLLDYLKSTGAKPLFVMYGINSLLFKNIELLTVIHDDILNELTKRDFNYVDLWEKTYQIGMISDAVRLGPYGWTKVNQAIYEYFNGGFNFDRIK